MQSKINSSAELWIYLIDRAGLDLKYYDIEIENNIKRQLGVEYSEEKLLSILSRKNISTNTLLSAFFQAVEPYSMMLEDLLKMFETAGANRGDSNIEIEFDFGDDCDQFEFDVESFRKWHLVWTSISSEVSARLWDNESLWSLNSSLRKFRDSDVNSIFIKEWLIELRETRRIPSSKIEPPIFNNSEFSQVLSSLWSLLNTVILEAVKYDRDINKIRQSDNIAIEEQRRNNESDYSWGRETLWLLFVEGWVETLIIGVTKLNESMERGDEEHIDTLKRLKSILDNIESKTITYEDLIKSLDDFLSLPIWEKRHELYSTWVGSQIISAIDFIDLRIHPYKGLLEFSFRGSHIATIDNVTPRLHLWAELRSPLSNPIGKGRKFSIQPDYSLLHDPVTNPLASILEVECKQYRKPSTRNFSAALTDYARGRENAVVVLVNYGPAPQRILDKIPIDVKHRTLIIGDMRPDRPNNLNKFKQIVKGQYRKYRDMVEADNENQYATTQIETIEGPETEKKLSKIVLNWGEKPKDLDLHLQISTSKQKARVKYDSEGTIDTFPFAQLRKDIQNGRGPEEIFISRWVEGRYECMVHQYSDDSTIAESSAIVRVYIDRVLVQQIRSPNKNNGKWWHVFSITSDGKLDVKNKILKNDPTMAYKSTN